VLLSNITSCDICCFNGGMFPLLSLHYKNVVLVNNFCINSCSNYFTDHWHCAHTTRSRVYETVRCPSVCPRLPVPAQHRVFRCGELCCCGPAGNRLLHGAQQRGVRRANAGSATLSAYVVTEHRLVTIVNNDDVRRQI